MDLIKLAINIWNIFLLFLFFLPGTILESTEENNNTKGTKKNLKLNFKRNDSMETVEKMSSTAESSISAALTVTTPTKTIVLSSLTKATTATAATTTRSIKFLFSERNKKNYTTKQEKQHNPYKEAKQMQRHMYISANNNHEIFKSTAATAPGATMSTKPVDEHPKAIEIVPRGFENKGYVALEHLQATVVYDSKNKLENKNKTRPLLKNAAKVVAAQKKILSNQKLTKNSLATDFQLNHRSVRFYNDQPTLRELTILDSSSNNEFYTNDRNISENNSNNMLQPSNYDGSGQTANTQSTTAITINSSNTSNQTTAVTTITKATATRKSFERKQNHMDDNNSALSYLPYKSAALKASAPAMKTLSNNFNTRTFSNISTRISSSSSLKRDTLLSLAGIITTAKPSVVGNSFMNNSFNTPQQTANERENVLKIQHNFNSNNSLVHENLATKPTSQTTKKPTPTTTTRATLNETSTASSLPFNVSSTYSSLTTATSKEIPTTTPTLATTSTSRATLKTTTRRRKIATTTLKPPPTIDDYQTITSQAGTHAYLPCNVKQLVKKPISWLRVRDGHILTVDQTTFIADQRFQSIYTINPERWSLQIKYVQVKDAGIYECQVSTEPKASAIVYLHIVEPKTELIGAPIRHVKAGSQVKLLCVISQALEPPLFINWFYNQKQIYLHNRKGWHTEIERIELPPDTTTTTTTSTTTTTTTTTTAAPPTTTVNISTLMPSSSLLLLSSISSSILNGSEISAMHLFTSTTPQQSLNDGNLLELVSESTYSNYPNLLQPEPASTSTAQRTQKTQRTTTSPETTVAATSATTATLPLALPATTTTPLFDDITDDNNDDDEIDYKTNPPATTFETAEAIASERGYMMLSSLMTFTDVRQITTASLIIPSVQKQDSGNYTCSPSNSEPRTVILHVLNGEYSASAITSAALNLRVQFKFIILNLPILTLIYSVLQNILLNKQHLIKRYSGG